MGSSWACIMLVLCSLCNSICHWCWVSSDTVPTTVCHAGGTGRLAGHIISLSSHEICYMARLPSYSMHMFVVSATGTNGRHDHARMANTQNYPSPPLPSPLNDDQAPFCATLLRSKTCLSSNGWTISCRASTPRNLFRPGLTITQLRKDLGRARLTPWLATASSVAPTHIATFIAAHANFSPVALSPERWDEGEANSQIGSSKR
jgi:hypothetical protein